MSALPPEADIRQRVEHVCFVPKADIFLTQAGTGRASDRSIWTKRRFAYVSPRKDLAGARWKLPGTKAPGCCGLFCLTALPLAAGLRSADHGKLCNKRIAKCGPVRRGNAVAQTRPKGWKMLWQFTVGVSAKGKADRIVVHAEDSLVAALKVKAERPAATIMYVRRLNRAATHVSHLTASLD